MTAPIQPPAAPPTLEALEAEGDALSAAPFLGDGGAARLMTVIEQVDRLALTDLPRALALLPRLIRVADAGTGEPRTRARRALGQALAYSNRCDDALRAFADASTIAEQTGLPLEAALARNSSVHALCRLGRFDDAIAAGLNARDAFVGAGRPDLAARSEVNVGVAHRMADRPLEAILHLDRALPIFAGQSIIVAQVQSNRAEALLDLGRFEEAHAAFEEALTAFEAAGAARAAAIVRGNLGDLAGRQGLLHTALDHFERARRALDESNAPGDAARLRIEQAEALLTLGMHAQAADAYAAAIPVLRESKLAAEEGRALAGYGRALARLDRKADAAEQFARAASVFSALNHTTGQARVRIAQAHLRFTSGDPAQARQTLDEALSLLKDRPADAAPAHLLAAQVAMALDDLPAARRSADAALDGARSLDLPQLVADALHVRARVLRAAGNTREALADFREAVRQIERLRGTLQYDRFRAAFLGDRNNAFLDAAAAALDAPESGVDEAFSLIERARARALLETLGIGRGSAIAARESGDEQLLDQLAANRAALTALYSRLDAPPTSAASPSQQSAPLRIEDWRSRISDRERAIDQLERRLASTGRFAGAFAEPVTLDQCLASLSSGEKLIEYFAEGESISSIIVSASGARVRRAFSDLASVRTALTDLSFQIGRAISRGLPGGSIGDRMAADACRPLAALYQLLIEPLDLNPDHATRLIIAPHGPLHAVPFHALARGEGPARRLLLDDFETCIVPSASVAAHLRRSSGVCSGGRLVVGLSDAAAPQAEGEAASIAAKLPGAVLLSGANATIAAFKAACVGKSVIHLATHARFIPTDPFASGVKLADGWMTTRDLCELDLQGASVVLSACDGGRASVAAGDEILGLARAFLLAGASSLILSLWPVHDASTCEMMELLYSQPTTPDAAADRGTFSLASRLRRAQQDLLKVRPHPAAWAPFICVGVP